MEDIHETSLDIMDALEESGVDIPLGLVALALTLGRVISPKLLSAEEEMSWLESVMEFAQLYFVNGPAQ